VYKILKIKILRGNQFSLSLPERGFIYAKGKLIRTAVAIELAA
jgi:hypothetical protein